MYYSKLINQHTRKAKKCSYTDEQIEAIDTKNASIQDSIQIDWSSVKKNRISDVKKEIHKLQCVVDGFIGTGATLEDVKLKKEFYWLYNYSNLTELI